VSSILEALRELEGARPPAGRRELPPAETPTVTPRIAGAVIPLLGGLAVGIVAFGVYMWAPGFVAPQVDQPRGPSAARPTPAGSVATDPGATGERPRWLDTAEAPRARVGRTAAAPTPAAPAAPERPAAVAPKRTPEPVADEPQEASPAPESRPSSSGGQVAVEAISNAANPEERVATMRIHGRRVTVRQHDSVDGLEIQLIEPHGVYVQRGGDVYLLPVTR
jgi:cell division septation protein DedD